MLWGIAEFWWNVIKGLFENADFALDEVLTLHRSIGARLVIK